MLKMCINKTSKIVNEVIFFIKFEFLLKNMLSFFDVQNSIFSSKPLNKEILESQVGNWFIIKNFENSVNEHLCKIKDF